MPSNNLETLLESYCLVTKGQFHQHFLPPFWNKRALRSVFLITVGLCTFLAQENCQKAACKMMMKLTTGWIVKTGNGFRKWEQKKSFRLSSDHDDVTK
jgi:hypothetical protein